MRERRNAREGRDTEIFYVLDGLYFIPSGKVNELLEFLCTHLPERIHLVWLSRGRVFGAPELLKLGAPVR